MRKLHNGYNICLFWETKEESQIKSFLYGEENTLKIFAIPCAEHYDKDFIYIVLNFRISL